MIDPNSSIAIYRQLKDILVEEIESGKWAPKSRISSENELCEKYDVSRVTVRKAMELLASEGYVYTVKGKGTYVKGKSIEQPLTHFYSFREDLRKRGVKIFSKMYSFEALPADGTLAQELEISEGDGVFRIERVFYADELAYAREISYIPVAICPSMTERQVAKNGLYNTLEKFNIHPTRAKEQLKAIPVDEETARMVNLKKNEAAIYLTRLTFSDNMVIEKNVSYVRGDMFVYSVELVNRLKP